MAKKNRDRRNKVPINHLYLGEEEKAMRIPEGYAKLEIMNPRGTILVSMVRFLDKLNKKRTGIEVGKDLD